MESMTTNDNGVDFIITVNEDDAPVDISSASVSVEFKRPDGSTFTRPAALNSGGTDGKILYQSSASDFEVDFAASLGIWQFRPIVNFVAQSTQFGGQSWEKFKLIK